MQTYDVIVIGAGPGGLTAGSYASRANLSVLVIDKGIYGGQMNDTAEIENYTGYNSIMGAELSEKMYESSMQFGAEYAFGEVESVTDEGKYKIVKTDMDTYKTKVVIIASGATHAKLGLDSESEYAGRGVSYCAVCDGAFFKNEEVVVVGGGDSAIEEAIYLSNLASKVTIVHRRDTLRAAKIAQSRAFKNPKINFVWNKQVEEVLGDNEQVTGLKLKDTVDGTESEIATNGTFIYVGINPNTKGFENLGILNDEGFVITNDQMETKVPGIYAIGDARERSIRQVASAVGDGSVAGKVMFDYIQSLSDEDEEVSV